MAFQVSHFFLLLFSNFIVEKLSEEIEVYEKLLPGLFSQSGFCTKDLQCLSANHGIKFENSEQLKRGLNKSKS